MPAWLTAMSMSPKWITSSTELSDLFSDRIFRMRSRILSCHSCRSYPCMESWGSALCKSHIFRSKARQIYSWYSINVVGSSQANESIWLLTEATWFSVGSVNILLTSIPDETRLLLTPWLRHVSKKFWLALTVRKLSLSYSYLEAVYLGPLLAYSSDLYESRD